MKYLVVGLGNIGAEYDSTRHNIGFSILDALAKASNIVFKEDRYGATASLRVKNAELLLLKPNTFMNLSGNAVRYWLQQAKIPVDNLLVAVDDLSLPFGAIRLKGSGSAGGHNGLKNIEQLLGTAKYARLRFGLGADYPKGKQIEYVLGHFSPEQQALLPQRLALAGEAICTFCLSGIEVAMNAFNNK